jgi:hypothetical protein
MEIEQRATESHLLIEKTLHQMIEEQRALLLKIGRRIIPRLTSEDVLQPNDYLELENDPHFRYEEGVLAGLQSIQIAILFENKKNI